MVFVMPAQYNPSWAYFEYDSKTGQAIYFGHDGERSAHEVTEYGWYSFDRKVSKGDWIVSSTRPTPAVTSG